MRRGKPLAISRSKVSRIASLLVTIQRNTLAFANALNCAPENLRPCAFLTFMGVFKSQAHVFSHYPKLPSLPYDSNVRNRRLARVVFLRLLVMCLNVVRVVLYSLLVLVVLRRWIACFTLRAYKHTFSSSVTPERWLCMSKVVYLFKMRGALSGAIKF